MVRVEVRDDDTPDVAGEPLELPGPAPPRIRQPEARVDDRPALVPGQEVRVDVPRPRRQRERDAPNAPGELVHPTQPYAARGCSRRWPKGTS